MGLFQARAPRMWSSNLDCYNGLLGCTDPRPHWHQGAGLSSSVRGPRRAPGILAWWHGSVALFSLKLSVCLWWHGYRRDDFPTPNYVVVMADPLAICWEHSRMAPPSARGSRCYETHYLATFRKKPPYFSVDITKDAIFRSLHGKGFRPPIPALL